MTRWYLKKSPARVQVRELFEIPHTLVQLANQRRTRKSIDFNHYFRMTITIVAVSATHDESFKFEKFHGIIVII
jgi:hypothetical protein